MHQLNAVGDPGLDPARRKEVYKKDQRWNIKTMGYDSVTKRNELSSNPKTRWEP